MGDPKPRLFPEPPQPVAAQPLIPMSQRDPVPTPLLILDIDGTVRQGRDDPLGRWVNNPEDVVVFPEAVAMMEAWRKSGGLIIGVSNQGGIALGHVTMAQVTETMRETQVQTGGRFDRIVWCRHHPDAEEPYMARCWCRKPRPGLAIIAAENLASKLHGIGVDVMFPPEKALMVGDRPEDQQCADTLNVEFEWAADWRARAGQL